MSGIVFNMGACIWDNPIVYLNSPQPSTPKANILSANERISQKGKLGSHCVNSCTFQEHEKGFQDAFQILNNSNKSHSWNKHFHLISPSVALKTHFLSTEIVGIFSGLKCHYVNDALRKRLGYDSEDWLGKSILPFVYPKDQKNVEEFFNKFVIPLLPNENIPSCRIKLLPKHTSQVVQNFELDFFNLDDSFKSSTVDHPVLRGVTFRNIDVEVAHEERAKKLGHELGNTLSITEQLFELINSEIGTITQGPGVDQTKLENIKRMFKLGAAQVRSASQRCKYEVRAGQTGRFEINNRPTNLFEELSNFAEINLEVNREGDVEFVYNIDPRLKNVFVNFDLSFFQPILENTIKNSKRAVLTARREIKSVSLNVQIKKDYGNTLDLSFTIQDTGTGFGSSFNQKKYSEVFNKDDRPNIIDNGYGLKHSVEKIQALGSELHISSDPLKGSILEFTLHVEKKPLELLLPSRKSTSSVSSDSTQAPLEKFLILVVDDNPLNRKLFQRRLEKFNVQCLLAKNGQEAVESARKNKFDIIFMDFEMPVKNGLEATKDIRSDDSSLNKQTQIWGLTGNQSDEDRITGLTAGMNEVLVKPANLDVISKHIAKCFTNRTFTEAAFPSPSPRPKYRKLKQENNSEIKT